MKNERGFRISRRQFVKAGAALTLSALMARCGPLDATLNPTSSRPTNTPFEPRVTETSMPPTPTAELAIPGEPYPTDESGFVLGAGGPASAEDRLRELGAGQDIDYLQAMTLTEVIRGGVTKQENLEWVFGLYESYPRSSWTMMAQDKKSGEFLWPKITTGPEAGQLVRAGNLAQYLNIDLREDFFDLLKLKSPYSLGDVEQGLVVDQTGWFMATVRSKQSGIPYLWFNADRDEWVPFRSFYPDGAARVTYESPTWFGYDSQGQKAWQFDSTKQEWVSLIYKSPEEAIKEIAEFSQRGSLVSESGRVEVNYSDALLDKVGIDKLRIDPVAMDESWRTMFNVAYDLGGRARGSRVLIQGGVHGKSPDPRGLSGVLSDVTVYVTTPNESRFINAAFSKLTASSSDFASLGLSVGLFGNIECYFRKDGRLIIVSDGSELYNFGKVPGDKNTFSGYILGTGFAGPGSNIFFGTNTRGFPGKRGHGDDGFWAFGCTREANLVCRNFVPDTLQITYK